MGAMTLLYDWFSDRSISWNIANAFCLGSSGCWLSLCKIDPFGVGSRGTHSGSINTVTTLLLASGFSIFKLSRPLV